MIDLNAYSVVFETFGDLGMTLKSIMCLWFRRKTGHLSHLRPSICYSFDGEKLNAVKHYTKIF